MSADAPVALPLVRVIFTGGTIASRRDETGHPVASASPAELLSAIDGIGAVAEIETDDVARVNGWNVTPDVMLETVSRVLDAAADERVAGVVVTHGTDTLEETAFLLDLFCRHVTSHTPVVVTGAMRAADELGADGPRNLRDAVVVATSPAARSRGVLVSFHERIFSARRVSKVSTTGLNPFGSPTGPVGSLRHGSPEFHEPPVDPTPMASQGLDQAVGLVMAATGDDGAVVDWHLGRRARGLVVVGTGAGNVPGGYEPALRRAIASGVPVVVTSRCRGLTAPVYSGPGGGAGLMAAGAIDGRGLSPAQARLALMAALAMDPRPEAVADWFERL